MGRSVASEQSRQVDRRMPKIFENRELEYRTQLYLAMEDLFHPR